MQKSLKAILEASRQLRRSGGHVPSYILGTGDDFNAITGTKRFNPKYVYEFKDSKISIAGRRGKTK